MHMWLYIYIYDSIHNWLSHDLPFTLTNEGHLWQMNVIRIFWAALSICVRVCVCVMSGPGLAVARGL